MVLVGTSLVTAASIAYPAILATLGRSRAALSGEAWRFVTPLFVERGGWAEIAFNLGSLAGVGILAEGLLGSGRWAAAYLAGGIAGEAFGVAWRPVGAGSSVAVCGLVGACAIWALLRRPSAAVVLAGIVVIVTGAVLTVGHNLHGPPILVGACAAGLLGVNKTEDKGAPSKKR